MAVLGIEIGGTKLQLGVGDGVSAELKTLVRRRVDRARGAAGILEQIDEVLGELGSEQLEAVGIGFGGPVDAEAGRVRLSHHVDGWRDFPLVEWMQERVSAPTRLVNDCDAAALGESRWGAAQGRGSMFYVTVGTGIGGGHVVDGRLQGGNRPSAAEIGHMRIGSRATPEHIVEAHASGTGIAQQAHTQLASSTTASVLRNNTEPIEQITSFDIATAAMEGDAFALRILSDAARTLGWAIGQMVTLLAPEIVVVGGGVSEMRGDLFLDQVERSARELTFPPLRDAFDFAPAKLGDAVVIHGAIAATQPRN